MIPVRAVESDRQGLMVMNLIALFNMPGYAEILLVAVVGLLLFGRRLPEVGRALGRTIVEFKKGIKGIDEDIEDASSRPSATTTPPPKPPEPAGTRGSDAGSPPAAL